MHLFCFTPVYKYMEQQSNPNFWKTILVNTCVVYPLILLSEIILGLFLPMEEVPPKLAIFLSVVIVVILMAWPVMPFVQKKLGRWINR